MGLVVLHQQRLREKGGWVIRLSCANVILTSFNDCENVGFICVTWDQTAGN